MKKTLSLIANHHPVYLAPDLNMIRVHIESGFLASTEWMPELGDEDPWKFESKSWDFE